MLRMCFDWFLLLFSFPEEDKQQGVVDARGSDHMKGLSGDLTSHLQGPDHDETEKNSLVGKT